MFVNVNWIIAKTLHFRVRSIGKFEIWISDFPIKHEIQKRISNYRNPFARWISKKKSKSGFHGFATFAFDWEIQSKGLVEPSR